MTSVDGSCNARHFFRRFLRRFVSTFDRPACSRGGLPLALMTMVPLTAGDIVELQGYFRAQDGYFAADHTSLWGCKIS